MRCIGSGSLKHALVAILSLALIVPAHLAAASEGNATASSKLMLSGKVVTAVLGDSFYVQEPDRTAGIRVTKTGHGTKVGDKVDVVGSLAMGGNGERYVAADSVQVKAENVEVRPLGMTNNSMGGWSWRPVQIAPKVWILVWKPYFVVNLPGAILPFPTGLLIRTWGRVTYVATDSSHLYIDDGSHLQDYAKTRMGVKVLSGAVGLDLSGYHVGDFLCITGVCTSYPDPTVGDALPSLRPRRNSDIQVIP